jgi:hypothetical protein
MPRSRREISCSWLNALKHTQSVDNSVDEIIVDPIFTPVSGLKPHCSFFVHPDKKSKKQVFADK